MNRGNSDHCLAESLLIGISRNGGMDKEYSLEEGTSSFGKMENRII
jgi:hypothetical protein